MEFSGLAGVNMTWGMTLCIRGTLEQVKLLQGTLELGIKSEIAGTADAPPPDGAKVIWRAGSSSELTINNRG